MTDQDLAARLDAVECRLDAAYPEPPDVPDPARIDALAERLADVEGALEAVEGYVGEIERVDDELERRADAALAATESVEDRLADLDADLEALGNRLDEVARSRPREVDAARCEPVAGEPTPAAEVARTPSTDGGGPGSAGSGAPGPGSGGHDVGPGPTGSTPDSPHATAGGSEPASGRTDPVSPDGADQTVGRSDAASARPGVAPAGTDAASARPNGEAGRAGEWAPSRRREASPTAVGDEAQRDGPSGGLGGGPAGERSTGARSPAVDGDGASAPGSVRGADAPSRSAAGAPTVSSWDDPGDGAATVPAVADDSATAEERDWGDEEGETLLNRLRDLL